MENAKISAVAVSTILDHLSGLVLPDTPAAVPAADPAQVLAAFCRDLYDARP